MAPIRYSLHYEDYSEHLMSRFGKLLQMQSLVDMTLMCSSHTLRVHKVVLAASSAYFQDVLQKQTGEPLIIFKMRFSVLKSLVEFMYCGKTQCLEENLDELVSAAQFLKIKGLSKVTKEGLGIANTNELPVFTPPVVINRPPQSLIDLHLQDTKEAKPPPPPPQMATASSTSQMVDPLGRTNKDMMVGIPFDVDKNGAGTSNVAYSETPRTIKPRRGRPSQRPGWETAGPLGRVAERALMRREQDSRKAIHQLKHLQTRYNQDYLDRVTLSQAVNSICGPESSTNNYMNIDSDYMYMDQTVSSNVLDPTISYSKEHNMGSETITSSYTTPSTNSANNTNSGITSAMSQYVNALKNAGLPTDLPILFESGDGSYINVNEQVLLDMVQSSEIQYEVIEQPNIIENVADPSEIKSIDDLSKLIERGEMLMNTKNYSGNRNYNKDASQYSRHEDTINSLNAILPDNLESFGEQHNYVVLDPRLQDSNNTMDQVNNDFSCIDGDMQFFTKSMSEDVKKYYEGQQTLDDASVMEQLCPASTTLDNSFNMSLLDSKSSHLGSGNLGQQYSSLHPEDLRRNEDCYDFGLDCLISTPKHDGSIKNKLYDNNQMDKDAQERDEIIKDLMNIEKNMSQGHDEKHTSVNVVDDGGANKSGNDRNYAENALDVGSVFDGESTEITDHASTKGDSHHISAAVTSSGIEWDNMDMCNNKENERHDFDNTQNISISNNDTLSNKLTSQSQFIDEQATVTDLTKSMNIKSENWHDMDKLNEKENFNNNSGPGTDPENDIPYAVGLQPLKKIKPIDENSLLKRRSSVEDSGLDNDDAKCLKRKRKFKKM